MMRNLFARRMCAYRWATACACLAGWVHGQTALADAPAPRPLPEFVEVIAEPATVELVGPGVLSTILVHGRGADGRLYDLTRQSVFRVKQGEIAVTAAGHVRGSADGAAIVEIEAAGRTLSVPVQVRDSAVARHYNFENDIIPLFSKFGCNSSGCHGKAEGQNGFKLSVFGFDPRADYDALIKEGRGRRVFPAAADRSLLLLKICGEAPHGGGVRISRGSREFDTLRGWIAAGLPLGQPDDAQVVSIDVAPTERVMDMQAEQQLRVTAHYSDGRQEDVTSLAKFQSNNDVLASVDEAGLMATSDSPGQAAIMASYMNEVAVFRAIIPRAEKIDNYPDIPTQNFIDPLVHSQLKKLNILPSELSDDAEFLRRVYLDVIGTLPTSQEARAFLSDKLPDRRARLIDELLQRPEFNDLWSLWWADILRVDRQALGHKGARAYYDWIHRSLEQNKPIDQFARELLTAEGPLAESPAGHFYQVVPEPGKIASTLSQVLLGVRIACAECHHHPFDQWSQTDYYGMTAFFTQVSRKKTPWGDALVVAGNPVTTHPRTGEAVTAHGLLTPAPEESPAGDRRQAFADWATAKDNRWFARSMANRMWAHFAGRGLVEPVDDFRQTNPPTNPDLLDALAQDFASHGFDLRYLIRSITNSRTYQLSSQPNATNERDEQSYSRAVFKRMPAEVLYDAVCQTTGVGEKFGGVPNGARAVQLWDNRVSHYFLKLFGRPVRQTACECERSSEANVAQVLHLMNSPEITDKLAHEAGRVAHLDRDIADDGQLIEEMYLTFFSRFPSAEERQSSLEYFQTATGDRRKKAEDLAWSMLNSLEFVFNH
ncbi:MAG: DUF1549 and DUF1553 domain-containing protein [Pirellulales bacterium]